MIIDKIAYFVVLNEDVYISHAQLLVLFESNVCYVYIVQKLIR